MIKYLLGTKIISETKLIDFFVKHDYDFDPPLSNRVDIPRYSKKLYNNAILIIAVDVNISLIVGLNAFYANNIKEKAAYLSNINVHKNYIGKGIAKGMLRLMHTYLINKGFCYVSLEVYRDNTKAINLYKNTGYRIKHEGSDSFLMTKSLLYCE